jgi:hypothetical protein
MPTRLSNPQVNSETANQKQIAAGEVQQTSFGFAMPAFLFLARSLQFVVH